MQTILDKIITETRKQLTYKEKITPLEVLKKYTTAQTHVRDFIHAISRPGEISIIAEMKQASPSAGILRQNYDVKEIATKFYKGGARAISVLTEEKYFKGSINHISIVHNTTELPILRKEFVISPYQIYETRTAGADAILLIAKILPKQQLKEYIHIAEEIGLQVVVEVHDKEDVNKVIDLKPQIIGINNRNLETFEVDINTTLNILSLLPENVATISESGIKSKADILKLKNAGINAVLIGELLMRSSDILTTLKSLNVN